MKIMYGHPDYPATMVGLEWARQNENSGRPYWDAPKSIVKAEVRRRLNRLHVAGQCPQCGGVGSDWVRLESWYNQDYIDHCACNAGVPGPDPEHLRGQVPPINHRVMVVFGGKDPEEQAARQAAEAAGLATATATAGGVPVHAGTAYQADGFRLDTGDTEKITYAVIFECSPAAAGELPVVARCDHHNPGDPGWGLGADQFWSASSLGQLCALLGVEPTEELLMVAAGDHCPADAYAGRCHGVDPKVFADFRIAGKAAFYAANPATVKKADKKMIHAAIQAATEKLQAAALVDGVRDLRTAGFIDELPEAALASGAAYMAAIPDTDRDRKPTGSTKIVLGGHTTPETVERFMEWGNSLPNRIGDAYGNPLRGFAGVVVKPE